MKTFVVLGMHRSATSLTAGGLEKSGIHMGEEYLEHDQSNPWGIFENRKFVSLNQKILKAAGGSWDNPPSRQAILKQDFDDEIKELIKNHEHEYWGWKDPRTSLTAELFHPHLTNPHYIVNFRDKDEVAKSLNRREGMPLHKGRELADIYNHRIVSFLTDVI